MRKDKYVVYGEYGGTFANLKEAKQCAKESSRFSDDGEVYLLTNGCYYIAYKNGKLVWDGWTIKY